MLVETSRASRLKADAVADDLIEPAQLMWRRSSRCGAAGSCVEIADLPAGSKAVRDSKLGETGPALIFTDSEWRSFILGVRDGDFD